MSKQIMIVAELMWQKLMCLGCGKNVDFCFDVDKLFMIEIPPKRRFLIVSCD